MRSISAVSDRGVGFDTQAAKVGRGLGLVSMEERLKLVKGTLFIESQLNRGTTVHARLPLSESDSTTWLKASSQTRHWE